MKAFRPCIRRPLPWIAVVGLLMAGVLGAVWRGSQAAVRLSADVYENPADGISLFRVTGELPASLSARLFRPEIEWRIESGSESVRVVGRTRTRRTGEWKLQATTRPGPVTIRASASGCEPATIRLRTVRTLEDRDGDGFPDVMRLTGLDDQENFRRWFAGVAESQYYRESPAWDDQQKDCSGLVRFAFREALRAHTTSWFQRVQPPIPLAAPDVRKYNYPQTPLGDRPFRTRSGPFMPADLRDDTFSGFADAQTIERYNTVPIGKDRRRAKPGDLLFYYQPGAQQLPYHLMIFLGEALIDGGGRDDWVVYHTGPADGSAGVIKKVTLAMLDQHPSPRWRPRAENPNFLGFYRFRILEREDE